MELNRVRLFVWIAAFSAMLAPAAAAQWASDLETFINAVRDRDGQKATELLNAPGSAVLNGRNLKGETALILAVSRHDSVWTQFLLKKGADPNVPSKSGETPLIAAARIGFADGVEWLIAKGAKVDATNRMGETALIVAVQQRHEPIVKTLLAEGADPDRADAAAGYSARDYAKRDTRNRNLLTLIEGSERSSQKLEDFKLE